MDPVTETSTPTLRREAGLRLWSYAFSGKALTAVEERREQVQRWHDLSVSTDGTWSQQADATS